MSHLRSFSLLALVCAVFSAWGQPRGSFNIYKVALSSKQTGGPGPVSPEYLVAARALRVYADCHVGECTEELAQFGSALCGVDHLVGDVRSNSLGLLVYDAARVSDRGKAIPLLGHLKARYPVLATMRFVYSSAGEEGDLPQLLSDGLHIEREDGSPWDEVVPFGNFAYNIGPWNRDSLEQLVAAAASVKVGACEPARIAAP
jgi:hypothetical protein